MEDNSISNIDSDEIFRSCKLSCSLYKSFLQRFRNYFIFFSITEANVEKNKKKISLFYSINNNKELLKGNGKIKSKNKISQACEQTSHL